MVHVPPDCDALRASPGASASAQSSQSLIPCSGSHPELQRAILLGNRVFAFVIEMRAYWAGWAPNPGNGVLIGRKEQELLNRTGDPARHHASVWMGRELGREWIHM